jgi:nitrite reductase/ring-hydroxylating ferredoxin subunit
MSTRLSRRDFIKLTGVTGTALLLVGCSGKASGKRTLFDQLQGVSFTDLPQIADAWHYQDGTLTLDLAKLPELASLGGAVRLEGDILPEPLLIVYGEDGQFYAFRNACTHAGRMIDPVAGTMTLTCCSISASTYDYQGNVLGGPAPEPLTSYPLALEGEQLIISLN